MIFHRSAITFFVVVFASSSPSWWNDGRYAGWHQHLVLAQEEDYGTKGMRGGRGGRGGHPNHGSDGLFGLVAGNSLDPTDPSSDVKGDSNGVDVGVGVGVGASIKGGRSEGMIDVGRGDHVDLIDPMDPSAVMLGDSDGIGGYDDGVTSYEAVDGHINLVDPSSFVMIGGMGEGVGSSNKGATRGDGMDIDLVGGGRFVPVDLSSSVAVGDGNVLEHSTVSSIDDIVDPLSIFPDKAMFVKANSDRLLKNNKAGKVGKNVKKGKKGKSKKEVDFPNSSDSSDEEVNEEVDFPNSSDSSDEEVNEQQCTIDLFRGTYRYITPCGKDFVATIACGEDDDTCRYSERVFAQNTCPENGLLNDEEEEDPCIVGGVFKRSDNINYNKNTHSCELAYFDLSEDRCELYSKEGGLGMKAAIDLLSRQEMLLWFSRDSGETFYNEEEPRIAVVSSDVDQYDTGRALSSDLIHVAKQRRLTCEECTGNQIIGGTASQSSTHPNYPTAVASLAIDGNLDTMWSGGSVTHTNNEMFPWWKVVLDREEIVGSIRVYNRGDSCCRSRLDNAFIRLFDGNGNMVYYQFMGPAQPVNEVFLEGGYTVKEVKITLPGFSKVLSLAEVQLFASPSPPPPTFAQVGQYGLCDAIELKEDLPSDDDYDYDYATEGNVGRNAVTQQTCEDSCASNMNCLSYSWSDAYNHLDDNYDVVLCKHYLQTATAKFEDAECWVKPKGTANVDAYKLGDGICLASRWSPRGTCSCNFDCGNPEDRADKGFGFVGDNKGYESLFTSVTWSNSLPGNCLLMGTNSPSDRIAVAVCKNKV